MPGQFSNFLAPGGRERRAAACLGGHEKFRARFHRPSTEHAGSALSPARTVCRTCIGQSEALMGLSFSLTRVDLDLVPEVVPWPDDFFEWFVSDMNRHSRGAAGGALGLLLEVPRLVPSESARGVHQMTDHLSTIKERSGGSRVWTSGMRLGSGNRNPAFRCPGSGSGCRGESSNFARRPPTTYSTLVYLEFDQLHFKVKLFSVYAYYYTAHAKPE